MVLDEGFMLVVLLVCWLVLVLLVFIYVYVVSDGDDVEFNVCLGTNLFYIFIGNNVRIFVFIGLFVYLCICIYV